MAEICTRYYDIYSRITIQIVNVIYGCLDDITKKKTFKKFLSTLIVKDDFKLTIVMYIFY